VCGGYSDLPLQTLQLTDDLTVRHTTGALIKFLVVKTQQVVEPILQRHAFKLCAHEIQTDESNVFACRQQSNDENATA
jgi:hypothetical protein